MSLDRVLACAFGVVRAFAMLLALTLAGGLNLSAGLFQLTCTGVFSTADALNPASAPTAIPFAAGTPYTLVAVFDGA